jgi:hypothetical protein
MSEEEKLDDDIHTTRACMTFGGPPTLYLFFFAIFPLLGLWVLLSVIYPALERVWLYGIIAILIAIIISGLIGESNYLREYDLLKIDPSQTRKQYLIALNNLFLGGNWFLVSLWLTIPLIIITIGAIPINPQTFYTVMYFLVGIAVLWTLWDIGTLLIRIQRYIEAKAQLRFEAI